MLIVFLIFFNQIPQKYRMLAQLPVPEQVEHSPNTIFLRLKFYLLSPKTQIPGKILWFFKPHFQLIFKQLKVHLRWFVYGSYIKIIWKLRDTCATYAPHMRHFHWFLIVRSVLKCIFGSAVLVLYFFIVKIYISYLVQYTFFMCECQVLF